MDKARHVKVLLRREPTRRKVYPGVVDGKPDIIRGSMDALLL